MTVLKKQYEFTPAEIRALVEAGDGDQVYCWVRPLDDDYLNNQSKDDECACASLLFREIR